MNLICKEDINIIMHSIYNVLKTTINGDKIIYYVKKSHHTFLRLG